MSGQDLRIGVERSGGTVVVAISGELRLSTAETVLGTTMEELVEHPLGIVLDLGEAYLGDELGLTAISVLARRAERERGVRFVLATPSAAVRRQLKQLGMSFIEVFDSAELACEALRTDCRPRDIAVPLPFAAEAAARARRAVHQACRAWGQERLSSDAQLIVSELVSNAYLHGRPQIELGISRGDPYLHLRVADASSEPPKQLRPVSPVNRGMGLSLVDELSTSWGYRPTRKGKTVWATLRLT
ncbi:MAG TPA: ATP-binding protein [Pseudonocardia sp.]|nr:ATP-binding protein [Pseudonocardia sp.]